mmetsp:Transcript_158885/g.509528  ORF Transcript_158885/g.509528 Transcript_158885/m.509528 type:complete len:590 (+) Transcript_158885:51-1820(+)
MAPLLEGPRPSAPSSLRPPLALLVLSLLVVGPSSSGRGGLWVEATLPAPHPAARLAFVAGDAPVQSGFLKLASRSVEPGQFAASFKLGSRTVDLVASGFERLESATVAEAEVLPPVGAGAEDISDLLRSSLLCELPCSMHIRVSGLLARTRYRMVTYHHSVTQPRGGTWLTLQYTGNNPVPLKQHEEGGSQRNAARHEEVAQSDSNGGIALLLKKTAISANAHMNLNAFEIEQVSDKYAAVESERQSCGSADHKDFGERLSLQECTDYVDGDMDCSKHFSWCLDAQGRCMCGLREGNSDCSSNKTDPIHDGRVDLDHRACNIYTIKEVVRAHFAAPGVFDCLHGPHVSPASCLEAAKKLLLPNKPKGGYLRVATWGPGDRMQPPHGCSLSDGNEATYNNGLGTSPPTGWRQICYGSSSAAGQAGSEGAGDCEPGFFNPEPEGYCRQCIGGYTRRRRASECSLCGDGYYDAGNFDDCRRCQGGETRRRRAESCTDCAEGYFDTTDADDCAICTAGGVRRRRAASCTECPVGKHSVESEDECADCNEGYTRRRRSTECTPCPANYYSSATQDDCTQCLDMTGGVCRLAAPA